MIFKPTVDLYVDGTDTNPVVPQGGKENQVFLSLDRNKYKLCYGKFITMRKVIVELI